MHPFRKILGEVCKRPGMYVGSCDFRLISIFLEGVDYAIRELRPDLADGGLSGFHPWLSVRLNSCVRSSWSEIILREDTGPDKFEALVELHDEFARDRSIRGLNAILADSEKRQAAAFLPGRVCWCELSVDEREQWRPGQKRSVKPGARITEGRYRLDGVELYLIRSTNGKDGVAVEEDGSIPSFRTRADLREYAERRGLAFDPEEPEEIDPDPDPGEPEEIDLDAVELWLSSRDPEAIDCGLFLDSWYLFSEIALSLGSAAFQRPTETAVDVFHKLFGNLPGMNPPGEESDPVWSVEEVAELHRLLNAGMMLVRDGVTTRA